MANFEEILKDVLGAKDINIMHLNSGGQYITSTKAIEAMKHCYNQALEDAAIRAKVIFTYKPVTHTTTLPLEIDDAYVDKNSILKLKI